MHNMSSLPDLDKDWKADQIRSFFLYLMVPLFHGMFQEDPSIYVTLCKFHKALTILFKPSITVGELNELEELLLYVYFDVSDIDKWHKSLVTINMHDMIHLVEQIKHNGCVCYTSGFIVETAVGKMKQLATVSSVSSYSMETYMALRRAVSIFISNLRAALEDDGDNDEAATAAAMRMTQAITESSSSNAEKEVSIALQELSLCNILNDMKKTRRRAWEKNTNVKHVTTVGASQLYAPRGKDEQEFLKKHTLLDNTDSYINVSTFSRICLHGLQDVYSESYTRKGMESSDKSGAFFLFSKDVNYNGTSGSFQSDYIGQAICFFNNAATKETMCFCKVHDYNGTGKAGEHISGMWLIDIQRSKLSLINVAQIIEPILCVHSTSLALTEIKILDGAYEHLGMVIKQVHKM